MTDSKRYAAYLTVLGLLVFVRFFALQADFPTEFGGYGMAYTDEGWWSRNAVAWVKEGNWYIDDGYNTITNLPVLPMIQVVWFKLFGVSLASARAIAVVCSVLVSGWVYLFARRELSVDFAWIAPLIVLTHYPTFAYSRLALLEMPMLVFLLASLWLATAGQKRAAFNIVMSGILFTLAVLTKTTALFAFPVVAVAIYCQQNTYSQQNTGREQLARPLSVREKILRSQSVRRDITWVRPVFVRFRFLLIWLLAVGVSLGLCYFLLAQLGDVQSQSYFANHNVAAKVPKGFFRFLKGPARVIERSFTLYPLLFPGLLGAVVVGAKAGKARDSALFRIVVLWVGAALCAFSLSDFAAPRYFLVLIVPIALAIPLWLAQLFQRAQAGGNAKRILLPVALFSKQISLLSALLLLLFLTSTGLSLFRMGDYLRQPQFTLIETAHAIDRYVESEAGRSNVVLGSFADTIALAADDVKAINDRMGFRPFAYRLEVLKPSYYLSIGPVGTLGKKADAEIKSALEDNYQLVLLDTFELFQRRDFGQPIFFYRLDSLE